MPSLFLPLHVSIHDSSRICDATGRAIAECWGLNGARGEPGVPAEDVARQIVAAAANPAELHAENQRLREALVRLVGLLEVHARSIEQAGHALSQAAAVAGHALTTRRAIRDQQRETALSALNSEHAFFPDEAWTQWLHRLAEAALLNSGADVGELLFELADRRGPEERPEACPVTLNP